MQTLFPNWAALSMRSTLINLIRKERSLLDITTKNRDSLLQCEPKSLFHEENSSISAHMWLKVGKVKQAGSLFPSQSGHLYHKRQSFHAVESYEAFRGVKECRNQQFLQQRLMEKQ